MKNPAAAAKPETPTHAPQDPMETLLALKLATADRAELVAALEEAVCIMTGERRECVERARAALAQAGA